jgi:hypothetical protein
MENKENIDNMTSIQNWTRKVFVIGVVAGGLVGLAGAYLFIQKGEDPDHLPTVTTGDAVRLGLLVLGLLRSIVELGDGR